MNKPSRLIFKGGTMKKIIWSLSALTLFSNIHFPKANAGVVGAVNGTAYSIIQGISEDAIYFPVGLGVTGVIGGGLIWGGAALMNHSPGSVGQVIGTVLLVLNDESLDEFENFVSVRYPFIENSNARFYLANELQKSYLSNKTASDCTEIKLSESQIKAISVIFDLEHSQRELLLLDLVRKD